MSHRPRRPGLQPRRQRATAPATPPSPSRCRTTAAPPTAARTPTRRPTRSRSTSPRSTMRRPAPTARSPCNEDDTVHLRGRRLRLHRSADDSAPTRFPAVIITTLPDRWHADPGGVAVTAGQTRSRPSRRWPAGLHPGGQRATAPATPRSPSRCRTTAAPPTAARTPTRRANTITHQRHLGQRCAGRHQQHGHHARGQRATPSVPPTSASPTRTMLRPTRCRR